MQDGDDIERLIQVVFDCGMAIHQDVGPGLMESVYERVLADRLARHGAKVDRQQPVHVEIDGIRYDDAFRYDLLLNGALLVEVKSIEKLGPVHNKQLASELWLRSFPARYEADRKRPVYQMNTAPSFPPASFTLCPSAFSHV